MKSEVIPFMSKPFIAKSKHSFAMIATIKDCIPSTISMLWLQYEYHNHYNSFVYEQWSLHSFFPWSKFKTSIILNVKFLLLVLFLVIKF
jgi:hypothetical protein